MKRFKNILLAAGGEGWEKSSLQKAAALAGNSRARLTVVDVLEELPGDLRRLVAAVHPGDLQKRAVLERRKQLERLLEPRDPGEREGAGREALSRDHPDGAEKQTRPGHQSGE